MEIDEIAAPVIDHTADNNSGLIVQAGKIDRSIINQIHNHHISNEIEYDRELGKEVKLRNIIYSAGVISIPAVLLGTFHVFGSSASILSFFIDPNHPASSKIFFSTIFFLIALTSLSGAIFLMFIAFTIKIGERVYIPLIDIFLEKQKDGKTRLTSYNSKCTIGKCSGTIRVKKAPANEEGIKYIGICSENSPQHRYSFDTTELIGEPITLKEPEPKKTT